MYLNCPGLTAGVFCSRSPVGQFLGRTPRRADTDNEVRGSLVGQFCQASNRNLNCICGQIRLVKCQRSALTATPGLTAGVLFCQKELAPETGITRAIARHLRPEEV